MEATTTPSRRSRFNQIVSILVRHNAWGLLRTWLGNRPDKGAQPAPVRLRVLLEELGPTFIKLGQLIATRPDLVSKEYIEELRHLYDATTPSPQPEIQRVLREGLGRDPGEVFASFDVNPIASASIGQVHKAILKDGTPVAVKVQHPGVADEMQTDFRILERITRFVERTFSATRVWQPLDHLEELRQMLERELDYRFEMRTTMAVAKNFEGDPTVRIPKIHPDLCSRQVLVMEFMDGEKLTRLEALPTSVDRRGLARHLTTAMARQIFEHRLFHADPSPGNLLVQGRDTVVFLDFGAVGMVTQRRARNILGLIAGIAKADADATGQCILELCDQRAEVDHKKFQADVEKLVDYFEREEVSVADPVLMDHIVGIARDHRMLLPPDFALITRALFQFEGFCRQLDPRFDLTSVLQPFVQDLVWQNLSDPRHQKELVQETMTELLKFGRDLPHTLNTVLRKIERNELSTRVEIAGLEGLKSAQGRGVLKTSFTVMMGAMVLGLAFIYTSPDPGARIGPFLFASGAVLAVWTFVMVFWSEAFKGNRE